MPDRLRKEQGEKIVARSSVLCSIETCAGIGATASGNISFAARARVVLLVIGSAQLTK